MGRFAQVGIALGALGIIIALLGLFPQFTGVPPTIGIGVIQVIMALFGYALLIMGAVIYVKFTFYLGVETSLAQSVGIRLAITGLLFASLAGFADIFGFGSHIRTESTDILFGNLQAIGILFSFALSSLGVMLYAIMGHPNIPE